MAGKEEMRIFVGGLSWDTTDRQLEDAFSRYGKILEAQLDFCERDLLSWIVSSNGSMISSV